MKTQMYDVSENNFLEDVLSGLDLPDSKEVEIVDSTLRKIQNMPGVSISPEDMLRIAVKSAEVGVAEIVLRLGVSYLTKETIKKWAKGVKLMSDQRIGVKMSSTTDFRSMNGQALMEMIDTAADSGVDRIHAVHALSDDELAKMGCTMEQYLDKLAETYEYVRGRGLAITAVLGDTFCVDIGRVIKQANRSIDLGASRLSLSDTFGNVSYDAMQFFIRRLKNGLRRKVPLQMHAHNHFGQASVMTVGSVVAGVTYPDVSMVAGGAKGAASFEEVVMMLELFYGVSTGIELSRLYEYSRLVRDVAGIPVYPYKAIIGDKAFQYDTDDNVLKILKERLNGKAFIAPYGPIAAELVGQKIEIVWDRQTLHGPATEEKIRQMGLGYTETDLKKILETIRANLDVKRYPAWLTEEEVEGIIKAELVKRGAVDSQTFAKG